MKRSKVEVNVNAGLLRMATLSLMILGLSVGQIVKADDAAFKMWHKVDEAKKCEVVDSLGSKKKEDSEKLVEEARELVFGTEENQNESDLKSFVEKWGTQPQLFAELLAATVASSIQEKDAKFDEETGKALREAFHAEIDSSSLSLDSRGNALKLLINKILDMKKSELESKDFSKTLFDKDIQKALSLFADEKSCNEEKKEDTKEKKDKEEVADKGDKDAKSTPPQGNLVGEQQPKDDGLNDKFKALCDYLNAQLDANKKGLEDALKKFSGLGDELKKLKDFLNDKANQDLNKQAPQVAENRRQENPLKGVEDFLKGLLQPEEQAQGQVARRDDSPVIPPRNDNQNDDGNQFPEVPPPQQPQPFQAPAQFQPFQGADTSVIQAKTAPGAAGLSSSVSAVSSAKRQAESKATNADALIASVNPQLVAIAGQAGHPMQGYAQLMLSQKVRELEAASNSISTEVDSWQALADSKRKEASDAKAQISRMLEGDANDLLEDSARTELNRLKAEESRLQSALQSAQGQQVPGVDNSQQVNGLNTQLQQVKTEIQNFTRTMAETGKGAKPKLLAQLDEAKKLDDEVGQLESKVKALSEKKTALNSKKSELEMGMMSSALASTGVTATRNTGMAERLPNVQSGGSRSRGPVGPSTLGTEFRGSLAR